MPPAITLVLRDEPPGEDEVVVGLEGPELVDGEHAALLGLVDGVDELDAELGEAVALPDGVERAQEADLVLLEEQLAGVAHLLHAPERKFNRNYGSIGLKKLWIMIQNHPN